MSISGTTINISLAVILLSGMIWLLNTFETKAGSDKKWDEHNQALLCRDVGSLEAQIADYNEKLLINKNLDEEVRQFYLRKIKELREKIKRKDPEGRC